MILVHLQLVAALLLFIKSIVTREQIRLRGRYSLIVQTTGIWGGSSNFESNHEILNASVWDMYDMFKSFAVFLALDNNTPLK